MTCCSPARDQVRQLDKLETAHGHPTLVEANPCSKGAAAPLLWIESTGRLLVASLKGRLTLAGLRLALAACVAISAVFCEATLVAAQAQPAARQQAAQRDIGTHGRLRLHRV